MQDRDALSALKDGMVVDVFAYISFGIEYRQTCVSCWYSFLFVLLVHTVHYFT